MKKEHLKAETEAKGWGGDDYGQWQAKRGKKQALEKR